jgi:hypothetical protein
MPGALIRIFPKTYFDFSMVAASQSMVQTVAKWIDVSRFREVSFVARWHSKNYNQSPSFKAEVFAEAPSPEDPAVDFVASPALATVGPVSLSAFTAPYTLIQPISGNFGSHLRVKFTAIQGATASSIFNFEISCDVFAKS